MPSARNLLACPCCGLVQARPEGNKAKTTPVSKSKLRCSRCHTDLGVAGLHRARQVQMLALSALIIYPAAVGLPMLQVERLGHNRQDSLLSGVSTLFAQEYWLIGSVIVIFSIILPPLKLLTLWWLTRPSFLAHPHRAMMYHLVEHLGRWGMLDVLLVAVMIAFVKLGDLVTITAGPGLTAFAVMVLLSLLASLLFNPRTMWQQEGNE